jgi:hypothetical protein
MPVPSISRDELRSIFSLPDEAIDALMASGRLLCHVRGTEIRFPLDQVEAFFRDGLVRVYQTMARSVEAGAPARRVVSEPATGTHITVGEAPAAAHIPVGEAPTATHTMGEAPTATLEQAIESLPETVEEPRDLASVHPVEIVEPEPEAERPDLRSAQRWIPRRQIDGTFNNARFSILQLSATGLRIRHVESLIPGDEAKLSFALMNPARSFVMRARVVWTSVARSEDGDATFCISGLRVTEHADRLATAIALLRKVHELAPEERRKTIRSPDAERMGAAIDGVSDEEVALVVRAAQHFANDPLDANRWYARARFAVSDDQVRRDAPPRPRDREEVLGIWEYLERQVEIPKIAGVLTWLRKTRQAQA